MDITTERAETTDKGSQQRARMVATARGGATLTLNGLSNAIGSLTGTGTVQNASSTAASLLVNEGISSSTFGGVLQDGTGGGALTVGVSGITGSLTLSGASNTYTGPTLVSGATLSIPTLGLGGSPSSIGAANSKSPSLVTSRSASFTVPL